MYKLSLKWEKPKKKLKTKYNKKIKQTSEKLKFAAD